MDSLYDILYPECHLDSPIVTGKLIQMLMYSNLPHNQSLDDEQLIMNIKQNKTKSVKTPLIATQESLGRFIQNLGIDVTKLNHIPYPNGNDYLFHIKSNELTQKLFSLIKLSHMSYSKISKRLVLLKKLVEKKIGVSYDDLDSISKNNQIENSMVNLHLKFEASRWFHTFLFWFAIKTDLRDLIKNQNKASRSSSGQILYYDLKDFWIIMNRNLVVIIIKRGYSVHYLTFEMVLMMCDVAEGRLMIDVAMSADQRYEDFKERGYALWDFIDSLFIDLGNQTYNIVAMIEPLTLGYLQLNDKSPILKGAFLKYALDEVVQEFKSNGFNDEQELELIITIINKIFNLDDLHMTAEFFSFFRTFGHPTLEATEAARKVREHMNKPKIIGFQTMMKGHALFCGFIINGFRDRHGGSWPPLKLPDHASKTIRNCQNNNESLTDEVCINEWKSFVGLRFSCFMPLSLDDDLTMFMKDKALAAIKREWDSVYPKETICYKPPSQTTSRRLVENFLEDSEFDPARLINYVISGEYLEDEEFNLSYSLKEKEIKKVGRLFAKMTYKMRACQVVAESLIANGVGKFFKENGMAKDEHELLKTLHRLSLSAVPRDNKINTRSEVNIQPKGNVNSISLNTTMKQSIVRGKKSSHNQNDLFKKEKTYCKNDKDRIQYETMSTFLTTDLQKFCLNWRQETTNIFAERLNEIYGLPNFFNWMHKRLEKSILYVADPYCPPYPTQHVNLDDVENNQIFIKYPMGGIEGYCQKLWTIITIPFLFLSAYEVGAKIAAVVQGDNQAIAITKRVHPNLPYREKKIQSTLLAQKYFNQLRSNMAKIGHNLKANETIVSSHFFVYSKRIYYDGLVLSQALKPISRAVFWSETIVDETRSACSNISTAISKSIEQGYSRWLGYSINILKVLQQLIISLKYTINPNMTDDITEPLIRNQSWLLSAALIPSQLGGFNYMNMCRLYVRNIGDPVTASIADVKRMIEVKLLNVNIIQKIMHQDTGNSDYLDWASDPYSINIPSSQSVTIMLKNITARTILANSENPMLKGLFHFDFDQEDRDLARFLLDRPLIIPRAAHEIMDNSLTGARQEIAGMLDTTKGLIRNSLRMGGLRPRLVDKLSMYDYNQFRSFNNLMRNSKKDFLIDEDACSVHLAISLRKKMWFNLTQGRPIYGLEVPDNIEVVNGCVIQDCEDCEMCSSGSKEFGWFFVPHDCELDAVNKENNMMRIPYFGSTTDERSEIKLSNVRSPSRALRSAIRIAMVYTWAFGDTDSNWEEAWYLASFRANVTIDELKAITPISTSNNIAHRLRDKSTQMKYSGSALNRVGRYIVISNDNLNFIVDGNKIDTNLVYQQIMLLGISSLEDRFRYTDNTGEFNTLLHLHINVNCCIMEMNSHPFVESEQVLPQLQLVEGNKLIYDDSPILDLEQEKIHRQLYRSNTLDFPSWHLPDLYVGLAQSLSSTIIDIISKENRDHLNEFKVISLEDDINSLITEFLLVDPNQFSLYLGLYIAINWSFDIYYRRPSGKYQMAEFIQTVLITSSKNNLSILSNAISHPTIFRRFWNTGLVEPIYGPNLLNQDYFRITIDLMVNSYLNYINYWLDFQEIEYMITESSDDIVDQRFEITQARHLCFIASLYLDKSDMPIIRGLTSIEKCACLTQKIEDVKYKLGRNVDWNTGILPVVIYPTSVTYIRRGTIKHIRLRNTLSQESFGYDKLLSDQAQPRLFKMPNYKPDPNHTESYYFPITALLTDDFNEFKFRINNYKEKNRWESHIQRRIGLNSTSCYKAAEITTYIHDKLNANEDRLFLGEGSGSMMATYYTLLGPSVNYFNTGVSSNDTLGQRVLSLHPSEYALVAKNNPDDCSMNNDLNVLFNGKPESTWIGNMNSFKYIMNTVKHHSCALIHSDMESSFEKDVYTIAVEQVHLLCLAVNLGTTDSIFITKLAPRHSDLTNNLIDLYLSFYSQVMCFIPSHSNPYSSEFYLIMTQKKHHTLIYPYMFQNSLNNTDHWSNIDISDIILNFKLSKYFASKIESEHSPDYLNSNLRQLTTVEKHLMSHGFKLNGPIHVKSICGHDLSTGRDNLIASISLSLNHIINFFDNTRDVIPFFDPYPLLEDSKVREMYFQLCKKIVVFFILYAEGNELEERHRHINNLRRKCLFIDLNSPFVSSLIPGYLKKRLENSQLRSVWSFQLSTVEIKKWWKVVGYSLLILSDH